MTQRKTIRIRIRQIHTQWQDSNRTHYTMMHKDFWLLIVCGMCVCANNKFIEMIFLG